MQINVNTDEARLISVYRAISDLETTNSVLQVSDASAVLEALKESIDLDQAEKDLSGTELRALIKGFALGLSAASGVPTSENDIEFIPDHDVYEPANETISGGPTGGVVAGQGTDPRYVNQTGVRSE